MSLSKQKNYFLLLLALAVALTGFAAAAAAADNAPALVITQIVPDTDNVSGMDAYELIEIYNNSGKDINLKGYNMIYAYSDDLQDSRNQIWPLDKTIKANGFLYIWVKQDNNPQKTSDFAAYWNVKEDQVISVTSAGMANTSRRVLAIVDPNNKEIVRAAYNDKANDEIAANKSSVFGVDSKGGTTLVTLGLKQDVVLGKLQPNQVPAPAAASSGASSSASGTSAGASSTSSAQVPSAMPKTGFGGTRGSDNAETFLWIVGGLAVAAAASVWVQARRKASSR